MSLNLSLLSIRKRLGYRILALTLFSSCSLSLGAADYEKTLQKFQKALKNKEYVTARETLTEATEIWPENLGLKYQWGQFMEEIGDPGAAIESYQQIVEMARADLYGDAQRKTWLSKSRQRLKILLGENPKIKKITEKYHNSNIKKGQKAIQKKQLSSARHAFLEAAKVDAINGQVVSGLQASRLKIPEPQINLETADDYTYEAVINEAKKLIMHKHYGEVPKILKAYCGTTKNKQQELHYLMATCLHKTGQMEEALLYYDIYMLFTAGSTDPETQMKRVEIVELLPTLNTTLKSIHRQKKVYIQSLLSFAQGNWKRRSRQAQKALNQIFAVDPGNLRAQKIQNRLIQLGTTPLFNRNMRKRWTLIPEPRGRTLASHRSDIRYKEGILTFPKTREPTLTESLTPFPNYGLLSANFRAFYSEGQPARNLGFGFTIGHSESSDTLLLLVTYEPYTSRIAVRASEYDDQGKYKSVGSLYTNLKTLEEWILLEVLRRGNYLEFHINKEFALKVRYKSSDLNGAIGLFAAGNAVQVKDFVYRSGANEYNQDAQTTPLFNRQNLAGWWHFDKSTQRALPLRASDSVKIDDNRLLVKVSPGNSVAVQNETPFPEDFLWENRFQMQPNAEQAKTEWTFGYEDHYESGYRIVLEYHKDHMTLSLLDDDSQSGPQVLDSTKLNLPRKSWQEYKLTLAVANNQAVVSIADKPLLASKLRRSASGTAGLALQNQVFSLVEMNLKRVSAFQ